MKEVVVMLEHGLRVISVDDDVESIRVPCHKPEYGYYWNGYELAPRFGQAIFSWDGKERDTEGRIVLR